MFILILDVEMWFLEMHIWICALPPCVAEIWKNTTFLLKTVINEKLKYMFNDKTRK